MGGESAEKYQGFEAGFRLHVSATYAAIKVCPCPGSIASATETHVSVTIGSRALPQLSVHIWRMLAATG